MKRFLLPFFFLILISIAYAQDYCRETTYTDSVNVFNDYNSVVHYDIEMESNAAIFTELEEYNNEGFFLAPSESKIINFNTYLPFSGDYELKITVTNSRADTKTYAYNFNVVNCHTITAKVVKENSYCLNGGKNYTIVINNTGTYNETLKFEMGAYEFTTTINSGEANNYTLNFYPKSVNDDYRNLKISNNYINYEEIIDFNVTNCDDTSYNITELNICEGLIEEHEFTIKNEGIHEDNYTITTNSRVINLKKNSTSLSPGEEDTIKFNIITSCEDNGLKLTSVTVDSALTGSMIVPINYYVDNCYDQKANIISPLTDYCEHDNKTFLVELENNGIRINTYYTNTSYGSVNNTSNHTLNPGESVEIRLEYNNITAEKLNYFFNSTSRNECTNNILLTGNVLVNNYEECYNGFLTLQERFYNNNTRAVISNNGTRNNTYLIEVFAPINEIDNASVTLPPGGQRTFVLNQLMLIHDEYKVDEFIVRLTGKGVNTTSTTVFYDNRITGMVVEAAANSSLYLGVTALLFLIYAFIRKK